MPTRDEQLLDRGVRPAPDRASDLSAICDARSASHIYLTFDDGPDPEWTPRILDLLGEAHAQATFFVIGEQARRAASLVRRIVEEGHALGNHTLSHRHPWTMTSRAARAQVRDGAAAISEAAGAMPSLFRPPHGRRRPCMTDEARRLGERVVMWDVSAIDWGPMGAAARILERLGAVRGGQIILMHDGRNRHNRPDQLLQALPALLRRLRELRLSSAALIAH
jgi:peptidoglycan/xylan/chitin deacetylase (PgdA/CDA1 family)